MGFFNSSSEILLVIFTFPGGEERTFEIYKTGIEVPGFRDFHERIQPFLLFYVDAASYIDADDEKWSYYLLLSLHSS